MDLKIRQQRIKEAHWTSCLRYSVQILLRKNSDSQNKAEVIGIMGSLENIPKYLYATSLLFQLPLKLKNCDSAPARVVLVEF